MPESRGPQFPAGGIPSVELAVEHVQVVAHGHRYRDVWCMVLAQADFASAVRDDDAAWSRYVAVLQLSGGRNTTKRRLGSQMVILQRPPPICSKPR